MSPSFLPTFSPEHIHPILVNFTAALLPSSFVSDLAGRALRKPSLTAAAWWMLVYGAAITPLTAVAGLWWKKRLGDVLSADLIVRHQWLGIGLAISFIALVLWRRSAYRADEAPSGLYLACAALVVIALMVQGSLGGSMLFGNG